jgi:hypothetical protein
MLLVSSDADHYEQRMHEEHTGLTPANAGVQNSSHPLSPISCERCRPTGDVAAGAATPEAPRKPPIRLWGGGVRKHGRSLVRTLQGVGHLDPTTSRHFVGRMLRPLDGVADHELPRGPERLLSLCRRSCADADPFPPLPTKPTWRSFSYEEVDRATNGFHPVTVTVTNKTPPGCFFISPISLIWHCR